MDLNFHTLKQSCRVCLQKGDVNIWDFKVKINETEAPHLEYGIPTDTFIMSSALELVQIFKDTSDILEMTEEIPLLCWECIENLRLSYLFYQKLKNSCIYLKKIYTECLSQYIEEDEEEHLIESPEYETTALTKDSIEAIERQEVEIGEANDTNFLIDDHVDEVAPVAMETTTTNRKRVLVNSSFVVTHFVPSTLESIPFVNQKAEADEEELQPQPKRQLLTLDCKAVEVQNVEQLESLENDIVLDNTMSNSSAVYVCQFCPQAFSKLEFLKTHTQKTHVCKFCTQPFQLAKELYRHIKEVHTEHRCVICERNFSSHTNLRHHIRRVHRINLPAKTTLLNFTQTTESEDKEDDIAADSSRDTNECAFLDESFDASMYFSKSEIIEDDLLNKCNLEI